MFKLNKRLIASAIAAAVVLPGAASASDLIWAPNTQITFARELIVNDGISLVTPHGLRLDAHPADAPQMATVKAGNVIRFKVTLEDNVVFNENATRPLADIVGSYVLGAELGGDGVTPLSAGTNGEVVNFSYTTGGSELIFDVRVPGDGKVVTPTEPNGWAISINGLDIKSLVKTIGKDAPGLGGVTAEITAQVWDGSGGRQILSGRRVIAKSKWGVVYSSLEATNKNARIDVVGANSFLCCGQTPTAIEDFNGRARFSPTGEVGGASAAGLTLNDIRRWSPGGVRIDIAKAAAENGGAMQYVLNFSGDGTSGTRQAWWNVHTRAVFDIKVMGTNLAAFSNPGGDMFLSRSTTCADADRFPAGWTRNLSADKATYNFTLPAAVISSLGGTQVTSNPPGPTDVYFCMVSNAKDNVMVVNEKLVGDIGVDYRLVTQRLTPPRGQFNLHPLLENGVSMVFQNVNPGKNATAQSFLRLTNNNAFDCPVFIDAKDDAGKHSGTFSYTLAPHASEQFNIDVLETGKDNRGRAVTGALDPNDRGTGKWYVRVTAGCGNFKGSALNRNATNGTVTNLTPEKTIGNQWLTPPVKL